MTRIPVLEIGGTHVTAAVVGTATEWPVSAGVVRRPVPQDGTAEDTLDAMAAAAHGIDAPHDAHWGVAVPGPFDYEAGIGRFRGIGKFESLHGVDVGAGLRARLLPRPAAIAFLNDADAFALGEHHCGAAAGRTRAVCLTLGTGIGSSFLRDGRPVHEGPDVPPGGRAHRIDVDGLPLEEVVSRRAIRAHYARGAGGTGGGVAASAGGGAGGAAGAGEEAGGGPGSSPDVDEIAARARLGDPQAVATLRYCFGALGRALAPWCLAFRPDVVVVGGSMTGSWDLLGPALRAGLGTASVTTPLRTALRPADAPLIGAARWALQAAGPVPGRT